MEKLSLASISADLNIGRTKLCALARQLSGGSTLTHMIAQRRVNAAKLLLSRSDTPVSTVAEAVGISDYNYFSKVFRNLTGMTPSAFRKAHRAKTSEKMNKNR
jgi:YesN/AraC family two-component response regulator